MDPHPDFADTALPRTAELSGYKLTPLAPEVTEEDFEAVTSSTSVLKGLFGGDWPDGLTLEENRIDMGWHDREFTARRSFAWVVRSSDDAYLGCAYIYPTVGQRGSAQVVTWIIDTENRGAIGADFNAQFEKWVAPFIPETVSLTWTKSPPD